MWEIYSIGDGKLLHQTLLAVSSIFATNNLMSMVKLIMLFSAIALGFQAIVQNRAIAFQQLFISWLIFSLLFIPQQRVVIRDIANNQLYSLAKVPLAIAVVGSVISSAGYQISRLMNQAFNLASAINNQINPDFMLLFELRANLIKGLADSSDINQQQNWINYLNDCSAVKFRLNPELNLKTQPLAQQLNFQSSIYSTKFNETNLSNYLSCSQAHQKLLNNKQQFIDQQLALIANGNKTQLNYLISSLTRGQMQAADYIWNTNLLLLLQNPQQQAYPLLAQTITQQAIQQKNANWAISGSMFINYLKPILSFFEAFIYGITPVIALLTLLGVTGIKMLGKYLALLLWLNLWHPIMVIINLFYMMSITGSLSRLVSARIELTSYIGLIEFELLLENYLATAGILFASVGSLAMFIVYGSSMMFNNLLTSSTANTGSNPTSPTAIEQKPLLSQQSQFTSSSFTGTSVANSEAALGSVNLSSAYSSVLSQGNSSLQQQQQAYQTTMSNQISTAVSDNWQSSYNQRIGQQILSSNSQIESLVNSASQNNVNSSSMSRRQIEEAVGAASLALNSNIGGIGKLFPSLGVGGSVATSNQNRKGEVAEVSQTMAFASSLIDNKQTSSMLSNSNSEDWYNTVGNSIEQTIGQKSSQSSNNSSSSIAQQMKEQRQLESFGYQMSGQQTISLAAFAHRLAENPQAQAYMSNLLTNNPQLAAQTSSQLGFYQQMLPDRQQAQMASALQSVFSNNSEQNLQMQAKFLEFYYANDNKH